MKIVNPINFEIELWNKHKPLLELLIKSKPGDCPELMKAFNIEFKTTATKTPTRIYTIEFFEPKDP